MPQPCPALLWPHRTNCLLCLRPLGSTGLRAFSNAIAQGVDIPGVGVLSSSVATREDVDRILAGCRAALFETLKLWEFCVLDVDTAVQAFRDALAARDAEGIVCSGAENPRIVAADSHTRHGAMADPDAAVAGYASRGADTPSDQYLEAACAAYRQSAERWNLARYERLNADLNEALMHLGNTLQYERVDPRGPQKGPITLGEERVCGKPKASPPPPGTQTGDRTLAVSTTKSPDPNPNPPTSVPANTSVLAWRMAFLHAAQPMVEAYFTNLRDASAPPATLEGLATVSPKMIDPLRSCCCGSSHLSCCRSQACPLQAVSLAHVVAHNGWIWDGNPLADFAGPESRAYLQRKVIVWSDSVKLRYGTSPSDSPFLWQFMTEYTQR